MKKNNRWAMYFLMYSAFLSTVFIFSFDFTSKLNSLRTQITALTRYAQHHIQDDMACMKYAEFLEYESGGTVIRSNRSWCRIRKFTTRIWTNIPLNTVYERLHIIKQAKTCTLQCKTEGKDNE